ncbi:hypothetical protein [Thalassobellus citreus]|uniref:hypothetical protein n=1 Tax=Thalassobellus citreus TaxID=3367752 RepID=UPI0037ACBC40
MEYKRPYGKNAFIRIELSKSTNNCYISNVTLQKNEIMDFFKNSKEMPSKNPIDCNSYESINNLVTDFEKNHPNEFIGFSGLQDPRQFKLEFMTDNGIRIYESCIGQSFKTNDNTLKKFNIIIKEILALANYKWRRIL